MTKQAPRGRVLGIDRRSTGAVDVVADVTELPLRSESVAEVWSSHCIEHLTYGQVTQCLVESFRVLKPSGVIHCYLPDLEYWVVRCLQEGLSGSVRDNLYGQQRHQWDVHQSGWTSGALGDALRQAGFSSVCAGRGRTIDELMVSGMKSEVHQVPFSCEDVDA